MIVRTTIPLICIYSFLHGLLIRYDLITTQFYLNLLIGMFMLIKCLANFSNDRSVFSTFKQLVILHSTRFVLLIHTIQRYSSIKTLTGIYKRKKFLFVLESYPESYDQGPTKCTSYL